MITPEIGRKHAQHAFRIEPVRFSPSGAAVDENAGGFKNMADDTMCRQQTMQPEAVTSRLEAADNVYRRVEPREQHGSCRDEIRASKAAGVATFDSDADVASPTLARGRRRASVDCTEFDSKEG